MKLDEAKKELNKNGYFIFEAIKKMTIGDYDVELTPKGKQKYDYIKKYLKPETFEFYANVIAPSFDDEDKLFKDNNPVFWKKFFESRHIIDYLVDSIKSKSIERENYGSLTDEKVEKNINDYKNSIDKHINILKNYYGTTTAEEYKELAYKVLKNWSDIYKENFEKNMQERVDNITTLTDSLQKDKDIHKKIKEEFGGMKIAGGVLKISTENLLTINEEDKNNSLTKRLPQSYIEKINSLKDDYYVNYIYVHWGTNVRDSGYRPYIRSKVTDKGLMYEIDKYIMIDFESKSDIEHKVPTQKETFPKLAKWYGKEFNVYELYDLLAYIDDLSDKEKTLIINWQTWYDKHVKGTADDPSWTGPNGNWSLD